MLKYLRVLAVAALIAAGPAVAQIQTVDPDQAMAEQNSAGGQAAGSEWVPESNAPQDDPQAPGAWAQDPPASGPDWGPPPDTAAQAPASDSGASSDAYPGSTYPSDTYSPDSYAPPAQAGTATTSDQNGSVARRTMQREATVPRDDVFNAAEGVFGRGAEGLASLLERILRDQGEPTAYIAGSEAGGAFIFGVRYGSGIMHHEIEGDRTVYWTGPSLGFDAGADANKVFVLVYNLHDTQDLFKRFPAGEGHAYFVGGFSAQYMRSGDVVLIPIRLGVGLRLGINAGYMRFSDHNRWLPF
jgi:hypothetical protein